MKVLISLLLLVSFICSFVLSINPKLIKYEKSVVSTYASDSCSPEFSVLFEYKSFNISSPQIYIKDLYQPYGSTLASFVSGTSYLFTVTHYNIPIGKSQPLSLEFIDSTGFADGVVLKWNFTNYATIDCEAVPTNLTMVPMQNSWARSDSVSYLNWKKIFRVGGLKHSVPYNAFTCTVPHPFYCYIAEYFNGPNPINFLVQILLRQANTQLEPFNVVISDSQGRVLHSSPFDGLNDPATPPIVVKSFETYPSNGMSIGQDEMGYGIYMFNILNKKVDFGVTASHDTFVNGGVFPLLGSPSNATYIGFSSTFGVGQVTSHLQLVDTQGLKRVSNDSTFYIKTKLYGSVVENGNVVVAQNSNINKQLVNVRADVTFNPTVSIGVHYSLYSESNSPSYPFLFSNGTVQYYSASSTFQVPKYATKSSGAFVSIGSNNGDGRFEQILDNVTFIDTTIPELLKVEMVPLSFEKVITRVYAKDVESGVSFIHYRNLHKVTAADLVYGDQYDGVYESIETLIVYYGYDKPTVSIYDNAGNNVQYDSIKSVYSTNFDSLPYYPLYKFVKDNTNGLDPYNFTAFEFKYNDIDVTNGPVNNTLCFNFAGSDKNMVPRFLFGIGPTNPASSLDSALPGSWDEVKGMFCNNFTIPARMFTGKFSYALIITPYLYDSMFLSMVIGEKSQLRITSDYADQMPPVITEFTAYPSNNVAITQNMNVGWDIRIEDSPNGMVSAEFNITSDYDLEPYTIRVTPSNAISGNSNNGVYQLRIPITASTCRSQSFRISSASISDSLGHTSISPSSANIHPFIKFLNSAQLTLNITCPQAIVDNVSPVLTSFTSSHNTIDVGTYRDFRNITFTFTTSDSGSGISSRHNPYVYLQSKDLDIISQVSKQLSNSNGVATYTATVQLPYGYGAYQDILISLYGIVDNQLNINGYSTLDLESIGFQSTIKVTYSNTPVLDSTSAINSTGTRLTIYGHKFGIDQSKLTLQIDYNKGQGWINTPVSFFSGIILMTQSIQPISTPFYVRVIVNGQTSNSILVTPTIFNGQCGSYEVIQSVVSTWINSEIYPFALISITIKNTGNKAIKLFNFVMDDVDQIWGVSINGNRYTLPSYNEIINPNDQYSFGYIIKGTTAGQLKDIQYSCL